MLVISVASFAQEKLGFADVDAGTYELYEGGKWEELISLANKGLDSGIDYYYLRMRAGIATYELQKYEKASMHFKKALKFNEADPLALEYLYYSLLFSGRTQEAKLFSARMPKATRQTIGAPSLFGLNGVFLEGGLVSMVGLDEFLSDQPSGNKVDHYLLKSYSYAGGGIDLSLGSRLSMRLGLNRMKFNTLQEVTLSSQFGKQVYDSLYQNPQSGLYVGGELTLGSNTYFGFGTHFIRGDFSYMNYRPAPMGMDQFTYESLNYSDFVLEGSVNHRIKNVLIGVNTSINNLGNTDRIQSGLKLIWYPKGNLDLYLLSQIDRLTTLNTDDGEWIVQGLAGTKVFSKLWMEIHAAGGRMDGWTEKSAYIVYNNQDPILLRSGINLVMPEIFKGITLSFRYLFQQRQHSWEITAGNGQSHWETEEYFTNSIIGGITWKF